MKRIAANEGKKSSGTSRALTILIPGLQSADLLLHLAQSLDLRQSLACIAATFQLLEYQKGGRRLHLKLTLRWRKHLLLR